MDTLEDLESDAYTLRALLRRDDLEDIERDQIAFDLRRIELTIKELGDK